VSPGSERTTALKEIDSYRDNYWCAESPQPQNVPMGDDEAAKPKLSDPHARVLKLVAGFGGNSICRNSSLGTAPNYFCRIAIAWAEQKSDRPRAPEALHLAVRSTRFAAPMPKPAAGPRQPMTYYTGAIQTRPGQRIRSTVLRDNLVMRR